MDVLLQPGGVVLELVRAIGLGWSLRPHPCPLCAPVLQVPACPACNCGAGAGSSSSGALALIAVAGLSFWVGTLAASPRLREWLANAGSPVVRGKPVEPEAVEVEEQLSVQEFTEAARAQARSARHGGGRR